MRDPNRGCPYGVVVGTPSRRPSHPLPPSRDFPGTARKGACRAARPANSSVLSRLSRSKRFLPAACWLLPLHPHPLPFR